MDEKFHIFYAFFECLFNINSFCVNFTHISTLMVVETSVGRLGERQGIIKWTQGPKEKDSEQGKGTEGETWARGCGVLIRRTWLLGTGIRTVSTHFWCCLPGVSSVWLRMQQDTEEEGMLPPQQERQFYDPPCSLAENKVEWDAQRRTSDRKRLLLWTECSSPIEMQYLPLGLEFDEIMCRRHLGTMLDKMLIYPQKRKGSPSV